MNLTGKKFKLWKEFGALNSKLVFEAFEHSLVSNEAVITNSTNYNDADVHVIWSVLWNGRMANNKSIWEYCQLNNKPIIVLEVGGIKRGITWKVGLNGVNRDAFFGTMDNDSTRAASLGLCLKPWQNKGEYILIAGQHDKSLQWQNQPLIKKWFFDTYTTIRKYTNRPILFRPHPRCKLENIEKNLKNVYRQEPKKLKNSYDDFDINFENIWATINWSSNPGIQSVINGVPSFVSVHSLAYEAANDIDFLHDIENPFTPDRTTWLNNYAWTEYTIEEISHGLPFKRLTIFKN